MLTSIRGPLAANLFAATLVIGSGMAAVPAFADETDPPKAVTVTGNVQLVSDYRFRGLSLSGGDPAIQGSINVNHSSGFYAGVWGSNLEQDAFDIYGNMELDVYAGWTGKLSSAVTADAGLLYYVYPSGSFGKGNYFEPYASVSTTLGPVTGKVGANYAWKQDAIGGDDNLYVYGELSAGIPKTPITIGGHLGYASGPQSPNLLTLKSTKGGFDYSATATWAITSNLSASVAYVGVDGNSFDSFSNDTVVGTVKLAF